MLHHRRVHHPLRVCHTVTRRSSQQRITCGGAGRPGNLVYLPEMNGAGQRRGCEEEQGSLRRHLRTEEDTALCPAE